MGDEEEVKLKMSLYIEQLIQHRESICAVVTQLVDTLKGGERTIFMTGVGKSGHIARKSVAIWQSLGLRCHFLHPQDSFHGDMGILRPGDAILYLSNSGKTEELVQLASYLRNWDLLQLGIVNMAGSPLESVVESCYTVSAGVQILEADIHSLVPSVSSTLFMILLDLVGIGLAEKGDFTVEAFRRNHPSGALGHQKR